MARTKQGGIHCGRNRYVNRAPHNLPPLGRWRPAGRNGLGGAINKLPTSSNNTANALSVATHTQISAVEFSISGACARTVPPALGADLLHKIFMKLAPSPKDLAPMEAVCTEWRQAMLDLTWRELCLEHAEGLCNELGYGREVVAMPPGGWKALYKLIVYCPGLHFPTFHQVLDCDILKERYSWRHGLGHVQRTLSKFCRGTQAMEALRLTSGPFAGNGILFSGVCSHAKAVELCEVPNVRGASMAAPPVFTCRGVVKLGCESSEAGVGIAAYLQQREIEASSFVDSISGEKVQWCPYCAAKTFLLGPQDFHGAYCEMYELIAASHKGCSDESSESEISDDSDSDTEPEPKQRTKAALAPVLMTGFACVNGHIVLAAVGALDKDWRTKDCAGDLVQNSGEDLPLKQSMAALYWSGHSPVRSGFRDGPDFLKSLELDSLVAAGNTLAVLQESWPTESRQLQGPCFQSFDSEHSCLLSAAKAEPAPFLRLLQAALPEDLEDAFHSCVVHGSPSARAFLSLVVAQLDEHPERKKRQAAKLDRAADVMQALRKAGFKPPTWPHPQSVKTYIQGPTAITLDEVVLRQKIARNTPGVPPRSACKSL